MLDTFSTNNENLKRRSWESSRSVLSSQPEEAEPDEKMDVNDFSKYAAVAAPKVQGKPKEGSRLVRKLKHFRKGSPFFFFFGTCSVY